VKKIEKYIGDIYLWFLRLSIVHQTLPPEEIDHSTIKNILVILRHQMGDMLCAIPMIRSIRKFYPRATITLVTKSSTNFTQLFKSGGFIVDEVKEFEYGIENFVVLVKELRDKEFDLAVVPSTVDFSTTNHLIAYYSRAKVRAGVSSMDFAENKAAFTLNVKNDFLWKTRKTHQIERNLDVIRQLNIEPAEKRIHIQPDNENLGFAQKFIAQYFADRTRPVIGFHPGAGKEGNIWPPLKFAELAFKLHDKFKSYTFISEGPSDKEYSSEMQRVLKQEFKLDDFAVHKGFLLNNISLISLTDLFVTNDTGMMHLAAGLGTPEVALFGPTQAEIWGPIGDNKFSIQSPTGKIEDISLEEVFDICRKILESRNR